MKAHRRIDPAVNRRVLLRCGWAAAALPASAAWAATLAPPSRRPSIPVRRPQGCVLLALARAGARLVACGERGIVIVSDDEGQSWRQAVVPVSTTLTAMAFRGARLGWAVGHAGAMLRTTDGGLTWQRQSTGASASDEDRTLLDVQFDNDRNGIAVGAFGLLVRTEDGGANWEQLPTDTSNPRGLHLYAVRRQGAATYVAGEQGLFAQLADAGRTLDVIPTPYAGSFFCMAATGDSLLLGGLRGTVLRWHQHRFETIDLPSKASVLSMRPLADGTVMAVNQAGDLLTLPPGAAAMTPLAAAGTPLTSAIDLTSRTFVGVGLFGATRFTATALPPSSRAGARS